MSYRRSYQQKDFQVFGTAPAETKLPTGKPIASYYRQSTQEQVGNISTAVQTVDMPAYLERLGWKRADIIMVDMDEGVSGTKEIDEREGMKLLFKLILDQKIGAVACQDEDRLFRDVTHIQVNIFIERCKSSKVLIITPSMIYDFAHPTYGTHHARQFRFKCEMAAEYIETVVRGKLYTARRNLMLAGRWAGAAIPTGYMVDTRKTLHDGSFNEHWRRLEIFEPYALVVREYFRMFAANGGNLAETLRQIRSSGPHYPDPNTCHPPEGFRICYRIKRNRDGWCPTTSTGLARIFTNAIYLGHAMFQNSIIRWNNHPPILDEETFFRAFDYISPVGLDGKPNLDYRPFQAQRRPSKEENRATDYPLLSGLLFSDWEGDWKPVGTHWRGENRLYSYTFYSHDGYGRPIWTKATKWLDQVIISLMLDKLKQTFDSDGWDRAVDRLTDGVEEECRLKEAQLRELTKIMENLIIALATLTTPQMLAKIEQRYQHALAEQERLQTDLARLKSKNQDRDKLKNLRNSFAVVLGNWPHISADEKREVVHLLVEKIEALKTDDSQLHCIIYWLDGSTDETTLGRSPTLGTRWLPNEAELLVELMESNASKLEIAQAFPNVKWEYILDKYRTITGKSSHYRREGTIMKKESYNDYLARIQTNGGSEAGSSLCSTTPKPWLAPPISC